MDSSIDHSEENSYTSLYLPRDLKQEIIEAARAKGYEVTRGRGSQLAEFVGVLLQERSILSESPLTPELRESIIRLSRLDSRQQQRVCKILELMLEDGEEQI
jgi:hypothetical protein